MKLNEAERGSLKFCVETLAELAQDKGVSVNKKVLASDIIGLLDGKKEVTAKTNLDTPIYNKAADIVCASIWNILNGSTEAGLKMFATILDADDATSLVKSLMDYNEAATELDETRKQQVRACGNIPLDGDNFGDTPDDYIDESLGPVEDGSATTMDDEDTPEFGDGEVDVLFDDTDNVDADSPDNDSLVEDSTTDGDDMFDDVDEVVASAMSDDNAANDITTDEDDADILPGSSDPVTDAKIQAERSKKKDEQLKEKGELKVNLALPDRIDEETDEILSSAFVKSLDRATRREITAIANKISMAGTDEARKKALKFIKASINTLQTER